MFKKELGDFVSFKFEDVIDFILYNNEGVATITNEKTGEALKIRQNLAKKQIEFFENDEVICVLDDEVIVELTDDNKPTDWRLFQEDEWKGGISRQQTVEF